MLRLENPLLKYSSTCILYDVSLFSILPILQRWEKNRPEDPARVEELSNTLKNSIFIDGIVYGWLFRNQILIYDGWTRISAASLLKKDIRLLLCVNYSKNEKDIILHFNTINKAVPVPLLYTGELDVFKKRKLLEDTCRLFCNTFKPFVSTARKPRKPNFNRDQLFDLLDKVLENLNDLDSFKIVQKLIEFNENLLTKHKDVAFPEKARKGGFFLFCLEDYALEKSLKQLFI